MNKYPNLQELIKYHPYSEATVCGHAGIEPELLHAILEGSEAFAPAEVIAIARLYECPVDVISCPCLIMLDMTRIRHKKMVRDVVSIYKQLGRMAEGGNNEAEGYLKWAA